MNVGFQTYSIMPLWLYALAILTLFASCHRRGLGYELQTVTEARLSLNSNLSKVSGIDSLLCTHVYGVQGIVHFDDMAWTNLSKNQKTRLVRCLADKRVAVREMPESDEKLELWTARADVSAMTLEIGTLKSGCIACDITEKKAEYRLEKRGTGYFAQEIPPEELWR